MTGEGCLAGLPRAGQNQDTPELARVFFLNIIRYDSPFHTVIIGYFKYYVNM